MFYSFLLRRILVSSFSVLTQTGVFLQYFKSFPLKILQFSCFSDTESPSFAIGTVCYFIQSFLTLPCSLYWEGKAPLSHIESLTNGVRPRGRTEKLWNRTNRPVRPWRCEAVSAFLELGSGVDLLVMELLPSLLSALKTRDPRSVEQEFNVSVGLNPSERRTGSSGWAAAL